jgi:hypothetical protein
VGKDLFSDGVCSGPRRGGDGIAECTANPVALINYVKTKIRRVSDTLSRYRIYGSALCTANCHQLFTVCSPLASSLGKPLARKEVAQLIVSLPLSIQHLAPSLVRNLHQRRKTCRRRIVE